ncbi:MAG TPA: MerR family transcriptional regulator [Euzebyales bacterium]|nr:MerR family transcriptional regulator [Euzebyales bacterium]
MRMAEFSQRSGAPVPTIKYYIREGLLPAGARTATNQAVYGPEHLARMDLIRALRDVAGLPIAVIRQVLDAVERPVHDGSTPDHLAVAFGALGDPLEVPAGEEEEYRQAADRVDEVIAAQGWRTRADSGARADLVRAGVAIDRHVPDGATTEVLARYAEVAERLAAFGIPETWDPAGDPAAALRYAVLGTVLYEPVILALRRLAHVDRHHRLSGTETDKRPPRGADQNGPSRSDSRRRTYQNSNARLANSSIDAATSRSGG